MMAVLPLGNSPWLLVIISLLVAALFIWVLLLLYKWDVLTGEKHYEEREYPPQPSNVRILHGQPYDYDGYPRPYDHEVDG